MFKIKDLNHKLSDFLADKDLLSLSLLNQYSYYNVFDEKFWKRKVFSTFNYNIQINIYEENWKYYYFLISKWLNYEDHIESVSFAIHEDRSDLLKMIYIKNNYKRNSPIYGWSNQNKNLLDPMTEIIEEDSIRCFDYIYTPAKHHIYILVKQVILIHSHRILAYLSDNIKKDHVYLILKHNCDTCAENLVNKKYANYDFLRNFGNYSQINETYNKPFHNIVKCIKNIQEIKNQALEENRFDLIKAMTRYTSQFSEFVIQHN